MFRDRFWITLLLTIPTLLWSHMMQGVLRVTARMNPPTTPIAHLADLVAALREEGPRTLELRASVPCPFSITLPPGFALTGKDKDSCALVFGNGDGIGLTADNRLANLTVIATPAVRAIYTQTGFSDMGSNTQHERCGVQGSSRPPHARPGSCTTTEDRRGGESNPMSIEQNKTR